jgi:potassium-transporting ATPase KdpC subunit
VSPSPSPRPPASVAPLPRPPRAHSLAGHLRAVGVFLALLLLVAGFAYPAVVTEIAQVIDPGAAGGSLLYYPNGTLAGSSLVAQNTDAPYLFWERPSSTDYNLTMGAPTPYGATEPALQAVLNETIAYMKEYGNFTVNGTLPFEWVAPSASSIDPDVVPDAVLIQIPRVSHATNLSIPFLQAFVNRHIVNPVIPYLGVSYVDVLQLDLALLPLIGK